jgi:hypothetical protein
VKESLESRRQDAKRRSYVSLLDGENNSSSHKHSLSASRGVSLERVTTAPAEGRKSSDAGERRKEKKGEGKEMKRFETFS